MTAPLTPDQISAELVRRGCRLYHAIDLPDFETYCVEWALLSRQQLESHPNGIRVPFYTDQSDKQKRLFDRCFGNLSNFGKLFWLFDWCVPNAFGTITLVFKPEAFSACDDVAICTYGANRKGFDLGTHRIQEKVKVALALAGNDPSDLGTNVEFSTSTSRLSFDFLHEIIVQPIEIGGVTLLAAVDEYVRAHANGRTMPTIRVESHASANPKAQGRFKELVNWSDALTGVPGEPATTLPTDVREWYVEVVNSNARPSLKLSCERTWKTLEHMRKPPAS